MKKTVLTKAEHQERRVSLEALLSEAVAHRQQAAYRIEMDGADKAELAKARANVSDLEDRIAALDAAWRAAEIEADETRSAEEIASRKAAVAAIGSALEQRAKIHLEMVGLFDQLGALVTASDEADDAIMKAAWPWLKPSQRDDLRLELGTGFSRIRERLIYALLAKAGVSLHRIPHGMPSETYLDCGLEKREADSHRSIRGRTVRFILPEENA